MFLAILYKNAAFLLLCGSTEGTSYGRPEGLPLVAKEVGVCTLRARFAGGKATTNKKLKKYFLTKLKFLVYKTVLYYKDILAV